MKLVCAIVSGTDADKITESLVSAGYPGPTRINTVGGFLRRGNATLLLGTDDERVEGAIDVIRSAVEIAPRRRTPTPAGPPSSSSNPPALSASSARLAIPEP